ncbi:MAG TPA: ATP-dependent DNA ligase [Casimicrobiaceae bacterium]|nr:ATP-dependent DNA ligase [Casimicrobiaceae bacterium]
MTLFRDVVETSERVGSVSGRKAKIAEIATLLRKLDGDEVPLVVGYLAGEIRQGKTGIGFAAIRDAQGKASTVSALTVIDLDRALEAIARTSGPGSATERKRRLTALYAAATAAEQSFITRLLLGELRQGALEGLMIEAVASAADLPAAEIRRAAMVAGGIASVAASAMTRGLDGLREFAITLFRPLAPMLAQPADDIDDALARIANRSIEWKLDGARVQVHKRGDDVRLFTRTGNDVTPAAPEIVDIVRKLPANELILDGEAIALRPDGSPYPFQDTMRRFGRVLEIDAMRASMPLSVFFFDCLRVDDRDVVGHPASARVQAISEVVPKPLLIPRIVPQGDAQARAFYDDAVARQHEGVMVKALDAPYEPGTRSASWLKVKRAHTLDLVVLAAEWGHGRRHGWLSNLHLGARDEATGEFVMLGKTFKGLTDAILEWQTNELLARAVQRGDWVVYVRPELVVEITFNDLQASPRYPAGLALRFARVKGYRPDKRAEDADTMATVRAIYAGQAAPHEPG